MPEALKKLIQNISMMPWIGEKTATKIGLFLLQTNNFFIEDFQKNLWNIKTKIHHCQNCYSLTDNTNKICSICRNETRDPYIICIVEEYMDMLTIEWAGWYNGVYHILWGAISPINGVFVGDLNFKPLFERIEKSEKKVELILATNPNIEGEATSSYIKEEIEKRHLKHHTTITRLSRWLSAGYIEYADNMTILSAMKERKEIK